jgi:hypothetical protein
VSRLLRKVEQTILSILKQMNIILQFDNLILHSFFQTADSMYSSLSFLKSIVAVFPWKQSANLIVNDIKISFVLNDQATSMIKFSVSDILVNQIRSIVSFSPFRDDQNTSSCSVQLVSIVHRHSEICSFHSRVQHNQQSLNSIIEEVQSLFFISEPIHNFFMRAAHVSHKVRILISPETVNNSSWPARSHSWLLLQPELNREQFQSVLAKCVSWHPRLSFLRLGLFVGKLVTVSDKIFTFAIERRETVWLFHPGICSTIIRLV